MGAKSMLTIVLATMAAQDIWYTSIHNTVVWRPPLGSTLFYLINSRLTNEVNDVNKLCELRFTLQF